MSNKTERATGLVPVVETAKSQVVNVPVNLVVPSVHNPRFMSAAKGMTELIDSIRGGGIRVPLLGRPHPDPNLLPGSIELASGHRRLEAARRLELGEVPMIVLDFDDKAFVEVLVAENADRENLHPLEEGRAITELQAVGWTIEEIAARFGRSASWVARRGALHQLIPPIRDLVTDPDSEWSDVPVGVLECIARLPEESQRDWFENNCDNDYPPGYACDSGARFNEYLMRDCLHRLSAAPWKLDDGELVPEAGPCNECPKRSSAQGLLFADLNEGKKAADHCLDAACWKRKEERAVKAKICRAQAEHGKVLLINKAPLNYQDEQAQLEAYKEFGKPVENYKVAPAKKSDKGAKPAVIISGPGAGSVTWVQPSKMGSDGRSARNQNRDRPASRVCKGAAAGGMSLKEKREALERRRQAWVVDHWKERLAELIKGKTPITLSLDWRESLLDLVAVFGQHHKQDLQEKAEWKKLDKVALNGDAEQEILRSLLIVWQGRLNHYQVGDVGRFDDEAAAQAEVLGFDLNPLVDQAREAIPEPKSWGKQSAVSDQQSAKAQGEPAGSSRRSSNAGKKKTTKAAKHD